MRELNQLVVLYAKPGREAVLRANLQALVAPSQKEDGNQRYELYEDAADARRFIFLERWASADAQSQHHHQSDHIRHFHENGDADVGRREIFYILKPVV